MDYDEFERRHRDREERRRDRAGRREEHKESRRRRRHAAPKEKVLHTRISDQLSDDIRSVAEELRVPVSNLVRNVLEEAFSVVETVSENVGDLVEDILEDAESAQHRFRRYQRRLRRDEWTPQRDDAHREDDLDDLDEDPADEPYDSVSTAPEPAAEAAAAQPETEPGSEPERSRPPFAEVLGWQPLVLNRDVECADCGRRVERGRRAFMGLVEGGVSSTFLCRRCTEER
jgi:hypothetical protein